MVDAKHAWIVDGQHARAGSKLILMWNVTKVLNLHNDGIGHWTLSWGKEKFFCIKCNFWYPLKFWRVYFD